ncbi:MAG TPA: hypothetical protein DEG17_04430 [Cyanobacteria bacterium UBA11149]|nr:hypothetical protein [Cyanobacteria bacterium UBA11366]HBR77144.1 hypothetical protein [Cyanobacteria bacterium UBA11159]HBS71215.1 hypothetical protein [Cyanobacteria bacterium UBA11153]HBW88137.1 hypothetical protein [Cyanobacteria bacterium UBA11149]
METHKGWLVVLDVSEWSVTFDFTTYGVKTGNQLVVQSIPAGLHRLGLGLRMTPSPAVWFNLAPGQIVGFRLNESVYQYEELSDTTLAEYKRLISSGAEIENFKNYMRLHDLGNEDRWVAWQKVTKHLKIESIPVKINENEAIEPPTNLSLEEHKNWLIKQPTRFEQILFNTHRGNPDLFLAEFEYVFIQKQYYHDHSQSLKRWEFIIQALYNAGERGIKKVPELFVSAVEVLMVQFAATPISNLNPDYVAMPGIGQRVPLDVVTGADYLVEDMMDSGIKTVVEKGREFEAYLKESGIIS